MKKFLMFTCFSFLGIATGFCQESNSLGVYVLEFKTKDGQQTNVTETLTDAVEKAFLFSSNINSVFRRIDYPDIPKMNQLVTPENIPYNLVISLKSKGIKQLIMGIVEIDDEGMVILSIDRYNVTDNTFESLGSQGFDMSDITERDNKINEFVEALSEEASSAEFDSYQILRDDPSEKNVIAHIMKYPDGQFEKEIEQLVLGDCTNKMKKELSACSQYLDIFPDGLFRDDIERTVFSIVVLSPTLQNVQNYREMFPVDRQYEIQIEDALIAKCKTETKPQSQLQWCNTYDSLYGADGRYAQETNNILRGIYKVNPIPKTPKKPSIGTMPTTMDSPGKSVAAAKAAAAAKARAEANKPIYVTFTLSNPKYRIKFDGKYLKFKKGRNGNYTAIFPVKKGLHKYEVYYALPVPISKKQITITKSTLIKYLP